MDHLRKMSEWYHFSDQMSRFEYEGDLPEKIKNIKIIVLEKGEDWQEVELITITPGELLEKALEIYKGAPKPVLSTVKHAYISGVMNRETGEIHLKSWYPTDWTMVHHPGNLFRLESLFGLTSLFMR